MAFHEVQFPTDISFGSKGGPRFNTDVVIIGSGFEQRNINWSQARCEYDVAYGVTTGEQLQSLIKFFRARWGKAHGFRYKDWADYSAVAQLCLEITSQTFQIQKIYESGSENYTRTIKKPISSGMLVYDNGVLQESGWSVNTVTGVITFSGTPTGPITCTFQYDVPVRFDTDQLSTSLENYNAAGTFFGGASVPLIEVKV